MPMGTGVPPPSAPALQHLPFVSAWCASFTVNDPELLRILDCAAGDVLGAHAADSLREASGATDYTLVAAELDFALAEKAAALSPPLTPSALSPTVSLAYTPFQAALLALKSFLRKTHVAPPETAPPPPPHMPFTSTSTGAFTAPSLAGTGSGVTKGCPADERGPAQAAALLLDQVAASPPLMSELRALEAKAVACSAAEFAAALEAASADVRGLVNSNLDHIEVAPLAREASLLLRSVARKASKGARMSLKAVEDLLVRPSVAPNPQFDRLMKLVGEGALHKVSEYDLTGSSEATKSKLFTGSASVADYMLMLTRVEIVMEIFANFHHQQQGIVKEFLLAFKKLAKHASDIQTPVSLIWDFIWVPFFREFAFECAESKESLSRAFPFLNPSLLALSGPYATRLNQQFNLALRSSAPPRPPPPPGTPGVPGNGGRGRALGPPSGSIPFWNPHMCKEAGWEALPPNRPPHNPPNPASCRGWMGRGKCMYGQNCNFKHPGY